MNTNNTNLFIGSNDSLNVLNGQAIINGSILFFYDDCDESEFDFPNYAGLFMIVSNERDGSVIKSFSSTTGLSRSGNAIIINLSVLDMTFTDAGKYYYELGYIISGGYEQILRYGEFNVE